MITIETKTLNIPQDYQPKFMQARGTNRAAKFRQVDNRLHLILSVSKLPPPFPDSVIFYEPQVGCNFCQYRIRRSAGIVREMRNVRLDNPFMFRVRVGTLLNQRSGKP
jgi:hypothetical protein